MVSRLPVLPVTACIHPRLNLCCILIENGRSASSVIRSRILRMIRLTWWGVLFKIKNIKGYWSFTLYLLLSSCHGFWCYALRLEAKVTGNCSNCHTMHNSQNGAHMQYLGPDESDTNPKSFCAIMFGLSFKDRREHLERRLTGAPIVFNSQQTFL